MRGALDQTPDAAPLLREGRDGLDLHLHAAPACPRSLGRRRVVSFDGCARRASASWRRRRALAGRGREGALRAAFSWRRIAGRRREGPRRRSGRRRRGAPPAARRHVGQKGLDPGLRGVDEAVGRVVHVLRAFRSRGSLLVIYKCSESMGGSLLPVLGRVTWAIGSESMALLRARCLVASGAGSPTSLSTAASYSGRGQRVIGLGRETRGSPPGSEKPGGLTRG